MLVWIVVVEGVDVAVEVVAVEIAVYVIVVVDVVVIVDVIVVEGIVVGETVHVSLETESFGGGRGLVG